MKKPNIKSFYYITHIKNLPSILSQGILSHKKVEELKISYTPIYNTSIISRRKDKPTPQKNSLWEYANLYLQPRNPIMYRVIRQLLRHRRTELAGDHPVVRAD